MAVANYSRRQKAGLLGALPLLAIMFLLSPPPDLGQEGWYVLGLASLMALLWMTECLDIAITALLPLVFFPMLAILPFADVARHYASSNIFLFMGGFFIAIAMQKCGLHRRIALRLILLMGSSPSRIVLGFMVATAILSMWISNTATTVMMYPLGLAIIFQFMESKTNEQDAELPFRTALMLGIAYAASIGGISTLVGTPPNLVFVSQFKELYPQAPAIAFADWFFIGLLLLFVFLPIAWLLLTRIVYRLGTEEIPGGKALLRGELEKLGKMQHAEKVVAAVFACTALAWVTRRSLTIGDFTFSGWAEPLGVSGFVHDGTIAMLAALVLFAWPTNWRTGEFVLDWPSAVQIPWGILILFGGGVALADGFRSTGLAVWIGSQLTVFQNMPLLIMILMITLLLTFLTELTSNLATITLFLPILASTAAAIGANPLLLMIPATISSSCAFMLPVATPPNAIIFASGYVTVPQMARAGIWLNLIGVLLVTLLTYFVVVPLFGIVPGQVPVWAQ